MNNLKVGTKLTLLTAILIGSLVFLGILAVTQLSAQNQRIQEIGSRDFVNNQRISDAHIAFQSAIRFQKNAVLAPTVKQSETFAASSRKAIAKFESIAQDLDASSDSRSEAAIRNLIDVFGQFKEVNEECLDLAVLNTNLKGMELVNTELLEHETILADYARKQGAKLVLDELPASEEKGSSDKTTKLAQRLNVELVAKLFKLHSLCVLHLNTLSSDPKFPELTRDLSALLVDLSKLGDASKDEEFPIESVQKICGLVPEIMDLSTIDSNNQSTQISLNAARELVDRVDAQLSDIAGAQKKSVTAALSASDQANDFAWRLITAAIATVVVIGLLVAYLISRSIVNPIAQVKRLANLMASGDLTSRIELKQADEVGLLADATNSLATSLSQIVGNVQQASSNLTSSAEQLTGVAKDMQNQSQRTTDLSSGVASASEQLSTNINTISSSAEEMSMNFASIASATEEMSMSINSISATAEETSTNVSAISGAMRQITDSFGTVMNDVHNGAKVANQASQMATAATSTMQQLDQSSVEISKVTETIKMIALQTNLLALNATIEATSAGEAGKGFAVVAHEIKQLANQSGRAAEDIANKIESVQKGTQQAVEVIQQIAEIIKDINASAERITGSVDQQSRSAQTIGNNISEASAGVVNIARSIAEVAQTANQMSRNIGEATRGASDVSRNVGEAARGANAISENIVEVNRGASLSNLSSSEVAKASQELCNLAEELSAISAKFKLSHA
jgi:methyl-accepting chemotaxis protein